MEIAKPNLKWAEFNTSYGIMPVEPTIRSIFDTLVAGQIDKKGDYYCVEVYTHGIEVKELKEICYEVSPYIYGYVPVEFMETLCLLHGGISNETKISRKGAKAK